MQLVKYGVISVDALCKDLLDWETLYVSGRMHKPVSVLRLVARSSNALCYRCDLCLHAQCSHCAIDCLASQRFALTKVAMLQSDARVRLAQQVNLTSALRVALLLLPEHFDEVELYTRIASISYTGDFRMSVPGGENADKVRNIVLGQREEFRRLYAGLMRSIGTLHVDEIQDGDFSITVSLSGMPFWTRSLDPGLAGFEARSRYGRR